MEQIKSEFEDRYEHVLAAVEANSPYGRKAPAKKKWMTVPEMGALLGLKKTERYWLVHKKFFECKEILGKMRINMESFEKWYANQIKYKKVTGEEPGEELKRWSYSTSDLAELLDVNINVIYDLLKREKIEVVIVDYLKRVPKEAFEKWYRSQSKYRTTEDRKRDQEIESATITMPEMARLLGIERKQVYGILENPQYKSFFEFVVIADRKKITKESFQKFLEGQDKYQLSPMNDYEELVMEDNVALANYRRRKIVKSGVRRGNGNKTYLTIDEAALLAKTSRTTVVNWYQKEKFSAVKVGNNVRIRRDEFEEWMDQRERSSV